MLHHLTHTVVSDSSDVTSTDQGFRGGSDTQPLWATEDNTHITGDGCETAWEVNHLGRFMLQKGL